MSQPPGPDAAPRPAATVMVVRPGKAGFEVFMVRRHQASKFAADVFVFPGGTIRQDDSLSESEAQHVGLDPVSLRESLAAHDDPLAGHGDGGLSLWVAALRELFEEAGLLLAEEDGPPLHRNADSPQFRGSTEPVSRTTMRSGRLLDLSDPDRAERYSSLRQKVQEGRLSLAALARAETLRLAADRLAYFSRWITPPISARRYDTRFFVAEVPAGQTAGHCQIETTDGLWITPGEALLREERGDFPLLFVTLEHLKRLAEFDSTTALLAFIGVKRTRVVLAEVDDQQRPYLTPEQKHWW